MTKYAACYASLETELDQHLFVLKMCCRVRKGLDKKINTRRIRAYTDWFRKYFLEPHFEFEKDYVFPMLGNNPRVKRALANHRRIMRLLSCGCEDLKVLNLLEEELSMHVRFEERVLYRELSSAATPRQMQEIRKLHSWQEIPEWPDKFWID